MVAVMQQTTYLDVQDPLAAARANACIALARAFAPPGRWDADLGRLLEAGFSGLEAEVVELALRVADQVADTVVDRTALAVSHARLFIGPFEIKAAPWASIYLDREQQLMGEASAYAAQAYAEAELGPVAGLHEAPDHLSHELEFMYFLAFREATTGDGEWLERQQRFWQEHLGVWLPQFAEVLARAAADSFYQDLARLTRSLCHMLDRELGSPRSRAVPAIEPEAPSDLH